MNDPKFFASVGISDLEDGVMMSFSVVLPIILSIILLWQRLVLKVSFPSLKQVFLHPEFIQRWVMRLFIILYLLRILMLYFRYGYSQESLISLYASVATFEIGLQMATEFGILLESECRYPVRAVEFEPHTKRRYPPQAPLISASLKIRALSSP
jgi:hypothetical protein